jgi:hypothetical protein
MRPAREASWRDVAAASSISSDVARVAIEEIVVVVVVGAIDGRMVGRVVSCTFGVGDHD